MCFHGIWIVFLLCIVHQSLHHESLHQEPLQIVTLIVVIKKSHTGSIQSLSFQVHRGCFFPPQKTPWLVCFLIIVTSTSVFLPMQCLLVPHPAAWRGLQLQLWVYCKTESLLFQNTYSSPEECSFYSVPTTSLWKYTLKDMHVLYR